MIETAVHSLFVIRLGSVYSHPPAALRRRRLAFDDILATMRETSSKLADGEDGEGGLLQQGGGRQRRLQRGQSGREY